MKRLLSISLLLALASCNPPVPVPSPSPTVAPSPSPSPTASPAPSPSPTPIIVFPPAPGGSFDCANRANVTGFVDVPNPTGKYIVVLKERGIVAQSTAARVFASGIEAQDIRFFGGRTIAGFHAAMTPQAARSIAARRDIVQLVQAEGWKHTVAVPWHLDLVDGRGGFDGVFAPGATGAGVEITVLDTGVDFAHPEFAGRTGRCFAAPGLDGCLDQQGHGTHVAGLAAGTTWGVARAATINSARALDANGSGTDSQVIAAIEKADEWHRFSGVPTVVNMSIGGGPAPALDTAVCNAMDDGVVFSVAAGNEAWDACEGSPADIWQALTVGAVDRNKRGASFTNFGRCVNIFAPGVDVESARMGGGSVPLSGTSMATPIVAGAAALYLERHPLASPAQVWMGLVEASTKNALTAIGVSSPNRLLYVREP